MGAEDFLIERAKTKLISLGSKLQLKNLLIHLQENNVYETFKNRFCELYKFIFANNLRIFIKNDITVDVYFIKGQDFTNLICELANSPDSFISLVNRWEGNFVRMNRDKTLQIATCVQLDFSFLEQHLISDIVSVEEIIATHLINYVNNYPNNQECKYLIFLECEKIIS